GRDVVVEIVVCIDNTVQEVVLVPPGAQHWWGGTPSFPRILVTLPSIRHFPLVVHHAPGQYFVQVPQNSAWRMFRRGAGGPAVHRSGPLVGMRNERDDEAEVSYGPYSIAIRITSAPARLTKRFSIVHLLPSRLSLLGVLIACAAH